MKYQALLLSAILVGLPATPRIHASPVAEASAQATFHDTVNSDANASHVPGVAAEASAYSAMDSWDYAEAFARSEIPGVVKAYAGGQGAYLGPMGASARASQTIEWLTASSTLPAGTPVLISLSVSFSGTLEATYYESASASASLLLGAESLYEAGGTGGYQAATGTGQWVGDFTQIAGGYVEDPSPRLAKRNVFLLDTVDTVTFGTTVGEVISLTLSLSADVTPGGFESGAWADFFDSGSYAFVGAQDLVSGAPLDVQFELVPEPSMFSLALLSATVLFVLRGRRLPGHTESISEAIEMGRAKSSTE
jgi:hypothetical protein